MGLLSSTTDLVFQIRGEGSQAVREFEKVRLAAVATTRDVSSSFASSTSYLGGFTAELGLITPAIKAITGGFIALGVASVKSATELESLKRGLVAVAGSSGAAELQLVRLREVAKLPGLNFREAIEGSIRLQAAGVSAELAERALQGFGNALATVGKGSAELEGVVRALSQIQAKGKVQAEEINQIAERLPQVRVLMQEAFGTARTEEIQKLKLTSSEFLRRMVEQLEKLPKVTGSSKTSFENLQDAAFIALSTIGEKMLPPVLKTVEELTKGIEENGQGWKQLGRDMGEAVKSAVSFAKYIREVGDAYQWAMGKAEEYGNAAHKSFTSQLPMEVQQYLAAMQGGLRAAGLMTPNKGGGVAGGNLGSEAGAMLGGMMEAEDKAAREEQYQASLKELEKAERDRIRALEEALEREKRFANLTLDAVQRANERRFELEAIYRRERLELVARAEQAETISHATAERARQGEEARLHVATIERLEREIKVAREVYADGARVSQLYHDLRVAQAERDAFVEEKQRRLTDAVKADTEARLANVAAISAQATAHREKRDAEGGGIGLADPSGLQEIVDSIKAPIQNPDDPMFGPPPDSISRWQEWASQLGGVLGQVSSSFGDLGSIAGGALSALAQGMEQTLHAFLMTGNLSIKAILNLTKSVVAGVAAQAAVKAIFSLAEGLIALTNPFTAWQAPFFFAAAKTYGVVAGVAAGVALAIPGGGSAAAGGAIAGGGSNGRMQNADDYASGSNRRPQADPNDKTIRESRTVVVHEHIVRPPDGWVVDEYVRDYRSAGPTRSVTRTDLLGEPA